LARRLWPHRPCPGPRRPRRRPPRLCPPPPPPVALDPGLGPSPGRIDDGPPGPGHPHEDTVTTGTVTEIATPTVTEILAAVAPIEAIGPGPVTGPPVLDTFGRRLHLSPRAQ
jgi:hypothetical protein